MPGAGGSGEPSLRRSGASRVGTDPQPAPGSCSGGNTWCRSPPRQQEGPGSLQSRPVLLASSETICSSIAPLSAANLWRSVWYRYAAPVNELGKPRRYAAASVSPSIPPSVRHGDRKGSRGKCPDPSLRLYALPSSSAPLLYPPALLSVSSRIQSPVQVQGLFFLPAAAARSLVLGARPRAGDARGGVSNRAGRHRLPGEGTGSASRC